MTLVTFGAAFLFFPQHAYSSEACSTLTDGQNGSPVVFFGGWLAQESDGQKWADGARATAQQNCAGRFKFEGHGLNGAGSDINSVEKKNVATIDECVRRIQDYKGSNKITLAGHSDGSWAVLAIVNKLSAQDRKKLQVDLLDGNLQQSWGANGPPASISCYTPSPSNVSSCNEIQWPPHRPGDAPYTTNMMQGICANHCKPHILENQTCNDKLWHAHFSLVNASTPCGIDIKKNFNAAAYQGRLSVPLDFIGCGGTSNNNGTTSRSSNQ